jgi:hypothetical protein
MKLNLVKYCKAEHADDAVKKGRIFVGTFSKYQKIENDALCDLDEGAATPAVIDNETELLISEDDNDSLLAHSSIKMDNGWKLKLPKGMPLWLNKPSFNTFIYCVATDSEPSIEKANRLGYESYFKITDPYHFGRALMLSISQHYKSPHGIRVEMAPVNYVPRKIQSINHNSPEVPEESFSMLDLFTKHERFSDDNEYRFILLEYSNSEQTEYNSLNTDGDIIENPEIRKWVKKS